MTVRLPEELEGFLRDQVRSGQYHSVDDVVIDALKRLKQALEAVPGAAPPKAPAPTEPAWRRVLENMNAVPDAVFDRIPTDSSEQLDHYLYGSPRRATP
jgi:hypothetical protein